ncbi:MAG: SMC-Scp complex subunit ScpB [Halobacteriales archaeon]|nr:SMC-Scp complex subunit ScpB [Halobacteriales archaeon]
MTGTAPDGTPIEVQRNFGKPTRAQELARALEEARKAKKPKGKSPSPAQTADDADAKSQSAPSAKSAVLGEPKHPRTAEGTEPTETKSSAPSAASAVAPKPAKSITQSVVQSAPKSRKMQVRFTGMKPMHVVEAALFAAGKPVGVEEVAEQTGLPPDQVKKGLAELQAAYQERDTVLEVGKAGTKWAMQVRTQAAEPAAKFAPMEIAPKLLKTLALIAFHQPMKQSQLVDMMGSKVYDHIPELVQRGLVRAREDGPTKVLSTTALFPEYFGLDASDPDEIRALMGRLVGIEAPPKPKAETVYEEPQAQEPEPAQAPAEAPSLQGK